MRNSGPLPFYVRPGLLRIGLVVAFISLLPLQVLSAEPRDSGASPGEERVFAGSGRAGAMAAGGHGSNELALRARGWVGATGTGSVVAEPGWVGAMEREKGKAAVPAAEKKDPLPSVAGSGKGSQVVLETNRGPMTIELFPDSAPKTVARFSELVKKGFYNGLVFYRVLPKFLVQTGDPTGDGTGGSGQTLPAEFNERKHVSGTVGMARRRDPDSADSQFYITLEPQPFLDGKYTVFGQVTEGLEILPQIQERDQVRKLTLKP